MALATLISVIAQPASTATAAATLASALALASTFWLACIKCFHLSESNRSSPKICYFCCCFVEVVVVVCASGTWETFSVKYFALWCAQSIYLLLNLFGICDLQKTLAIIYLFGLLFVNIFGLLESRFYSQFGSVHQSSVETIVNRELSAGRGRRGALTLLTHLWTNVRKMFCGLIFFPLSSLFRLYVSCFYLSHYLTLSLCVSVLQLYLLLPFLYLPPVYRLCLFLIFFLMSLSPLIPALSLSLCISLSYSTPTLSHSHSLSLFQHVSRAAITLRLCTACPGHAQAVHCLFSAQTLVKQCNVIATTDQQTVGAIPCAGQCLQGLLGHLEATQSA